MRRASIVAGILAVVAAGVALPGMAQADSVSLGVQTNNIQLGIHIGPTPPPLVAVPAPVGVAPGSPGPPPPPVYTAPNLPYNYFVYQRVYYLYHEGRWFRARRHSGPWTAIAIAQVPRPVLAVPIEHYRVKPAHWEHHGPPAWAHERERGWEHDRGHGHDRDGKHHDRGHGQDHE